MLKSPTKLIIDINWNIFQSMNMVSLSKSPIMHVTVSSCIYIFVGVYNAERIVSWGLRQGHVSLGLHERHGLPLINGRRNSLGETSIVTAALSAESNCIIRDKINR